MHEQLIEAELGSASVLVKVWDRGGVAAAAALPGSRSLDAALSSIEVICRSFAGVMDSIRPSAAKVSFSIELAVKGSGLIAVLCGVEGKGGIQVEMEWKDQPKA